MKPDSIRTAIPTYTATIYLGLREGYHRRQHKVDEVSAACQAYCKNNGLCVTVTPTHFVYVDGNEVGAAVGLINYPREPADPISIQNQAIDLAEFLKDRFKQIRVTVVFPDQTVMLGPVE